MKNSNAFNTEQLRPNKKLLITGGSGFLGSRIAAYYNNKYDIIAPSHSEMDITDTASVEQIFEKYRPNIVIHCAAQSNVGYCEEHQDETWRINVDGSVNISKASLKYGAKCIICSSDQVYFGSKLDEAHKENEELSPANQYGKEKLCAEKMSLAINSDVVFLRLPWMYDVNSKTDKEHSDFIRTLIPKLQASEIIEYPIYDVRGITNVNEIISNIEHTFSLSGGVYNFGSSNDKNTYETVKTAFELAHLDTSVIKPNLKAFADNHRNISMCTDKINSHDIYFTSTVDGISNTLKNLK